MSEEIVCNGKITTLPSLEVVKKVNKNPFSSPNMNWLLHIHYTRQDFTTCRRIIDFLIENYYNHEYCYFIKGLIEKNEGNLMEALRNFQKAIDMNSKNVENFKEAGKTLYAMGRTKRALEVFKEAETVINRPDHEIFHYIGEILSTNVEQSNDESRAKAKEYLQKAVLYGKKLESYQKLAEIYRREKNYQKAIEILEASLQISQENTEILTEIGILYLKMNDSKSAFSRLLEVSNIHEKCLRGLIAFGAILQSRNDVEGALAKYQKNYGEEYEGPAIWNNIGLCFFKKKKLVTAISCLRKSIWMSPMNYSSLYNLSLVFVAAHQYASAFQTLAAAINIRSESAECYMLLGICLRNLKDYENSFAAFEKASTLPDAQRNPLIYLNFAVFCYETGRIEKTVENFNNFMKIFHQHNLPAEYKLTVTKLKAVLQHQTIQSASDFNDFIHENEEKEIEPNVQIKGGGKLINENV